MKAYRRADGSIWTFRPDQNAARFVRSARRLALPELPPAAFIGSLKALVEVDHEWVPSPEHGEASLYLRPFMFASEAFLGVRPAAKVTYSVIASPAGPYFSGGLKPVSIWVSSEYVRAAPGGGAAKCGGTTRRAWRRRSRRRATAATRSPSSTGSSTAGWRSSVG